MAVEQVRQQADVALFVVSRPADRFDAIEQPAAVTGLPVVRAEREIDPQLLRSAELGFLNGHVPVTGILSAIAVLAAVLTGRDAVVMSNEWSASIPTLEFGGRPVNHQFSKSEEFEAAFRGVLADQGRPACRSTSPGSGTGPSCGWGASSRRSPGTTTRSAAVTRPFIPNGRGDSPTGAASATSACFIDLILAPFLPAGALRRIFAVAGEPLDDPGAASPSSGRCSARAPSRSNASARSPSAGPRCCWPRGADDRADSGLLQELAAEVASWPDAPSQAETAAMLEPVGRNFIPDRYR